jgi:hypothetical protein
MPQRIQMNIINTNSRTLQINNSNNQNTNKVTMPSSLNSAMIGRIHNIRPGCGSCGRH